MSIPEIEQRLIAAGVAPHIAAYIAEQRPLTWFKISWLFIPIMIAGFAVGGLWLWPALENLTEANAHEAARRAGALLYYQNFGFGLVIGLFAWIFASGAIIGALPLLSPRLMASAFCESVFDAQRRRSPSMGDVVARWSVNALLKDQVGQTNPAAYVRRFTVSWLRYAVIATVALGLLSAITVAREVDVHGVYTREGFTQTHTLPLPPTSHAWSEATALETGCNHVTGRDASDDPVYSVHFRDGSDIRLENATPLTGTWIEQMEIIDAAVVKSGAVVRPWRWLNRTSFHPDCLAMQRAWRGEAGYARLLRLLHHQDG